MNNIIEIKNLSKYYPGFSLEGLNLTLPCGCIMGLIGENGAGKTTTIRLILDMIHRDGGSVTLLGKDDPASVRLAKEEIGIVPDEIGFPERLTAVQIGHIMQHTYTAWQGEVYRGYLRTFSLPENKAFGEYSLGMKKKLAIAVAMSHQPKLLILDEATGGLDPVVRDELLDLFLDFIRDEQHSILISSHIVSDLEKICDYIAFLRKGKLLLCEEKDRLREQYCVVHCSRGELERFPREAVMGRRVSEYGAEAVVRKNMVPHNIEKSPVSIEELFIYMVKGEKEK